MALNEMNRILAQLQRVGDCLPTDAAERAARRILSHERVFVHGAGRSGLMLRALAMRLAQMGRCVYVAGETVTPAIRRGDLLIVASASGTTASVLRAAEVARSCGADVLTITATADSPLTAVHPADVLMDTPTKDRAQADGQAMGSLFEQALLIFGDAVVQCMGADPLQMRKNHANLE